MYAINPGLRDSASSFSTRDFMLYTPDFNELHFVTNRVPYGWRVLYLGVGLN